MNDAILINLADYTHSGEGANGESLFHNTDSRLMLKMFESNVDVDAIRHELNMAVRVYATGIPTPKPGQLVTDGNGRYGIQFERIIGKKSFARATGEDPDKADVYARRFASLCKRLHAVHLQPGEFTDIREYYLNILDRSTVYTTQERNILARYIEQAPDGDTAIHGDLQFGNAIMVGDKDYFIDLGDFTCGSPLFDLGMVLFTCLYDNVQFMRQVFHLEPETAKVFWLNFVKGYFGESADPSEVEELLRPYAALKLLIIEKYAGSAIPEYHWLIK